jgi:diguanylate cyclase (GGDEF)-like protein
MKPYHDIKAPQTIMNSKTTIRMVVVKIAIVVSFVELLIMLLLDIVPFQMDATLEAPVDAFFLVLLTTPIIYLWVIKPFIIARDEATHLARHDPLTHVSNRLYLLENLERCLAACARQKTYAALMYIDLDDFKIINDMHGHNTGDDILIAVANRMKSITRLEDIIFRIGGDEFLVLIHQLNEDKEIAQNKSMKLAQKYHQFLQEPFQLDGKQLQIHSSIGVRILGGKQQEADEIIKEADSAMYKAKKLGGGNIILFDE